jgi:hypothetical protein
MTCTFEEISMDGQYIQWWQNFISGLVGAVMGGTIAAIAGWHGARYAFQTHLKRLRKNKIDVVKEDLGSPPSGEQVEA